MIILRNISKRYEHLNVLEDITLTINEGEIYGLMGASGAGKSTLLRIINLLESPSVGSIIVNGKSMRDLKDFELRQVRKSIGMVFQHYQLLGNKTVIENVEIALKLAGKPKRERKERAIECLNFVGLGEHINKYPAQLSGGQKQRVAIARAIANQPKILLCDEPTSALDPATTAEVLQVLTAINETFGVTIVIVSHEMHVIKSICQRVCVLDKGRIYQEVELQPAGIQESVQNPQTFVDALVKGGQ